MFNVSIYCGFIEFKLTYAIYAQVVFAHFLQSNSSQYIPNVTTILSKGGNSAFHSMLHWRLGEYYFNNGKFREAKPHLEVAINGREWMTYCTAHKHYVKITPIKILLNFSIKFFGSKIIICLTLCRSRRGSDSACRYTGPLLPSFALQT